jgi:osmotically-inducible protein OsmY
MSNDDVIVDEIRAALERDPRLPHPAEVAVSERAGTVTLRGSVASPRQRRAAVQIAKTVAGVRDVEDELKVDPRDRFDDDQIRGVAIQALMSDPEVPDDRIEVTVADAWLSLKGEVEHQYESNAAFAAVSGIPGVGGITTEIRVITAGVDG